MTLPRSAFIDPQVQLDTSARVGEGCVLDGEVLVHAQVQLGSGVLVQGPCTLHASAQVHAGAKLIGPHASAMSTSVTSATGASQRLNVGAGACIEAGALLVGALDIGAGARVQAGAVVTQSVPPHAIVSGSPARITGYTQSHPAQSASSMHASALLGEQGPTVLPLAVQATTGGVTRAVQLHRLKRVQDMRGDLSVGEFADDIPFEAQRYFLVYNVPSEHTRGAHAHKACHQFLICVSGSCSVVVDDGQRRAEVLLDAPHLGLYMPPMVWGIQYNYSPGAVLLVYASHRYDADDYIREYSAFIAEISAENT